MCDIVGVLTQLNIIIAQKAFYFCRPKWGNPADKIAF